jgi:DNA-binding transcriptional LysR family regulator
MIERYHLRYFLAVLDAGNFSRAAAVCHVSQPTLSVGIARLEAALGQPVFRRSNRRVELTEAGARFAAHARTIEETFARAERAAAATPVGRTVRLGMLSTVPAAWVEALVRRERARAGGDRLEIVEGRPRDLRERLGRGRLDLALTLVSAAADGEALLAEGYSLALAADHPLASRASIRAEELAGEPMIVRRHCEALAETSRHFTARGVRPFFPARATDDARALAYVRAGLGITVMPDCFAAPGVARVPLEGFAATRTLGLARASGGRDADPPVEAVARALAELVAAAGG